MACGRLRALVEGLVTAHDACRSGWFSALRRSSDDWLVENEDLLLELPAIAQYVSREEITRGAWTPRELIEDAARSAPLGEGDDCIGGLGEGSAQAREGCSISPVEPLESAQHYEELHRQMRLEGDRHILFCGPGEMHLARPYISIGGGRW